jgi:prefoldin subunit 5
VRDAVAGVFAVVNVSEILQSAIERCKEIEGRAVDAEKQIEILASTVNRLQSANEELQREVAILQASSVL